MTGEQRVDTETLRHLATDLFERCGVSPEDAAVAADALVVSNLRGVDSHGVRNLPPYVEALREGRMNPACRPEVQRNSGTVAVWDAGLALGPPVGVRAMRAAIDRARRHGMGVVYLRRSYHLGMLSYYPLIAAREGVIGLTIGTTRPNVAPYGAAARGVGNTPVSIAAPRKQGPPLVLDIALSVAASGKLSLFRDRGEPLPEGWAIDRQGRPTRDPVEAQKGAHLPVGGYKGSGLSLMFEVMISLLLANPLLTPHLTAKQAPHQAQAEWDRGFNTLFLATDVASFRPLADFEAEVEDLVAALKALPRVEGCAEILMPGELEDRVEADRLRHGIPLSEPLLVRLEESCRTVGVVFPF